MTETTRGRGDFLKAGALGAAAVVGAAAIAPNAKAGTLSAMKSSGEPDWLKQQEQTVDAYMGQMLASVPYPTAQMRDSLERRNLRDRLLRFNKPEKVGYVYLMSFGKFVGYYVVKGKITSTQSQMTPMQKAYDSDGGSGHDEVVVDSPGDDGSWGANEGGDKGIFFFTSSGVMVETTLDWMYSDAPLHIDVPNLLGHK
jgi:hypothetical protein